jgi:methyltransferase (TIGR00027 family)
VSQNTRGGKRGEASPTAGWTTAYDRKIVIVGGSGGGRVAQGLPEGVGETAIGAAMMRARESARADALFEDRYAAAFVSAVPPIFEHGPTADDDPALAELEAAFEEVVAVRTRFFDEFVTEAAGSGCFQVVLLGAGLDTRAFRLDWPAGVRLFELDAAGVLDFKERVLSGCAAEPRYERITVAVDLQQPEWSATTVALGFDAWRRAAWVAEGLLPYLTSNASERLLAGVGELSSPQSRLALDHPGGPDDATLDRARSMASMSDIASLWQGGLSEGAGRWLSQHGWETQTVHGGTVSAAYGRSMGSTQRLHGVFVTARRPT